MSQFREVITRMAVDTEFADHARSHPDEVAAEFGLTPDETAQMLALTDSDPADGPTELDTRLSLSGIGSGGAAGLLAALGKPGDPDSGRDEPASSRWIGPGTQPHRGSAD